MLGPYGRAWKSGELHSTLGSPYLYQITISQPETRNSLIIVLVVTVLFLRDCLVALRLSQLICGGMLCSQ